jgi:hypothetical protein
MTHHRHYPFDSSRIPGFRSFSPRVGLISGPIRGQVSQNFAVVVITLALLVGVSIVWIAMR